MSAPAACALSAGQQVVAACLNYRLPGRLPVPEAAYRNGLPESVEILCRGKLAGVLLGVTREDRFEVPDATHRLLSAVAEREVMTALSADALARDALLRLREAGVPFVVTKGPAVARIHREKNLRSYSDIDIIVRPSDFLRARAELEATGLRSRTSNEQLRAWFDQRCREGINLQALGKGNIDLHHHVPPWYLGRALRPEEIYDRSTTGRIAGVEVQMASAEDSLLIASLHVISDLYKDDASLSTWRDLLVIGDHLGGDRVIAIYRDADLLWLLEVLHEQSPFGTALVDPPPRRAGPSRWERAAQRRVRLLGWGATERGLAKYPYSWAARLPVPNALAFVAASLVPSREFLSSRHGTYRSYWRSGARHHRLVRQGADFRHIQ